jgi:hypothetical protein
VCNCVEGLHSVVSECILTLGGVSLTGVGGRSLCRWDEKTGGPRENGERKGEAKGEAKGEEDGRRPLRPSGGNRGELAENRFLWTPDNGVCMSRGRQERH